MATDFSSRPKPPVLKRFANLDIDGIDKPERKPPTPAKAPSAIGARANAPIVPAPRPATRPLEDADLRDLARLGDELNDNARSTQAAPPGPRSRFTMPMPTGPAAATRAQRAAELRRTRPPDPILPPPPPSRRAPITTQLGVNARLWEAPRNPAPIEDRDRFGSGFEGTTPGVITVEMDLRRGRSDRTRAARTASPPPLELTPLAARQIMLMAWEAGVPGSALRILTCSVGGLGRPEIDFAFDEHLEADDVIFESHGVTILIDPSSLPWVSGRRITWHDVPGSEGFRVA